MIILVSDGDVNRRKLWQLQMILNPCAQDPFPVHDVAGTIDGPVRVDVRGPPASLPAAKSVAAGRDRGYVVTVGSQHPEVVRLRLRSGHLQRGQPVGIGGAGGLLLLAKTCAHLDPGNARAGNAIDRIRQHTAAPGARDHGHAADHQQGVGLEMTVGGFDQVEPGGQRVNGQLLRVGHVGGGQFLTPARNQLVIVQQWDLGELGHADDAAPAGEIGLMGAQAIAVLLGELTAEEAADEEPEVMLPVVKFLQPGALVDLFFRAEGGSVVEAMQVR